MSKRQKHGKCGNECHHHNATPNNRYPYAIMIKCLRCWFALMPISFILYLTFYVLFTKWYEKVFLWCRCCCWWCEYATVVTISRCVITFFIFVISWINFSRDTLLTSEWSFINFNCEMMNTLRIISDKTPFAFELYVCLMYSLRAGMLTRSPFNWICCESIE